MKGAAKGERMSEPLHDAHVNIYESALIEFEAAWEKHEQIDQCKADIQRWERLEQNAPTPSEAITAEHKLAGLRAELTRLLGQLSGATQEHPQATTSQPPTAPSPAPARSEPVHVASADADRILKKRMLVQNLQHRWPTIEADLREASRNGLSKAAHRGRGWCEMSAEKWADENGKLSRAESTSAWLRNSIEGRTAPDPRRIYPTRTVSGVPSCVNRFRMAARTCSSAT